MTAITSLGTVLNVTISSVLTPIAGIRDVDWNPGEVETMEIDDLDDEYVNLLPSGRSGGGEVTGEMFTDFAQASWTKLIGLWGTPAEEAFSIDYPDAGTSTQLFDGILKSIPIKAERAAPLMTALAIAVSQKPTLV